MTQPDRRSLLASLVAALAGAAAVASPPKCSPAGPREVAEQRFGAVTARPPSRTVRPSPHSVKRHG